MTGAPGTGRRMRIGPARAATSAPVMTWSTSGSSRAAEASTRTIRAWGYGQRASAISAVCARSTSSVNWPSPRSRRSSSLRLVQVPSTFSPCRTRVSWSVTSVTGRAPPPGREMRLDRAHDELITGAPAEDPGQFVADLSTRRLPFARRERCGRHEEARRAEAALQRMVLLEAFLQRAESLAGSEGFDGLDPPPVQLGGQHQARLDRLAVHEHRAHAAYALFAADVSAGQPEAVAKKVRRVEAGRHLFGDCPPVHLHSHDNIWFGQAQWEVIEVGGIHRAMPRCRISTITLSTTDTALSAAATLLHRSGGGRAGNGVPAGTSPAGPPPAIVPARGPALSGAGISPPRARRRLAANSPVTLPACLAMTFWPTLPSAPASTMSASTATLVPSGRFRSRTVHSVRMLPMAPRTLRPAARKRISSSGARSSTVTFASKVAVIGPTLWVARTRTLSSSRMFTNSTPGMQLATDSGCSRNLQTVPAGSATMNSSCSFISRPSP